MTANNDLERRLTDHYAAVAPSSAPDWVLEQALANVHDTTQRRVLRLVPRRLDNMNTFTKLAMAAVVVIAVGALGIGVLRPDRTVTPAAPAPSTSPSPAASVQPSASPSAAVAAQPPVEVTGTIACGPPVNPSRAGTAETVDVGSDGLVLTRTRDGAWVQTVTMSDPRLEGAIYQTWEGDSYRMPGAEKGPEMFAATRRIVNGDGAWESRSIGGAYADGTAIGETPEVFIGEGAYEGLIAILETTSLDAQGCVGEMRGMIFAGAPLPEPYIPN